MVYKVLPMLTDIIEAGPFIDVVLDDEPGSSDLPLLNPGFNEVHASPQLFPAILKARLALATHKEAYRLTVDDAALIQHQCLSEAAYGLRLDGHESSPTFQVANPVRRPEHSDPNLVQRAAAMSALVPLVRAQGLSPQVLQKLSFSVLGEDSASGHESTQPVESAAPHVDTSHHQAGVHSVNRPRAQRNVHLTNRLREAPLQSSLALSSRFNPPSNRQDIERLFRNWVEYVEVAGRQTEPLIVAAVAYYQLLAISPYLHENHALSRMVFQLLLIDMGLIDRPVLSLSREILINETEHRLLFEEVALSGDWHNWLVFCAEIVRKAAVRSTDTLHVYQQTEIRIQQSIKSALPKLDYKELSDLLFRHPVCRIRDLVEQGFAKRQTASIYLKALVAEGILTEQQQGKEKWFFNHRYLSLFD